MKKRIEMATSRTAQWTCLARAISSLEKRPCYRSDDRLASSLLPGFLRLLIHISYTGRLFLWVFAAKGIYEYVIARTKYIDSVFRTTLSHRFSQVLLLGAGFDTRALRFQQETRGSKIFELDAPATQEAKIRQYKKRHLSIPSHVVFIPIDFERDSLPIRLSQVGFKRDERTLFILEGVLMYLQPQSVNETFRTIQDLAAVGSEVVFDYIYASVLRHENIYYGEKGTIEIMAKAGEQWRFGIEKGEIAQFLLRFGFKLQDHRDARELEEMYFKDPFGRIVGRVNGTHCLVRAMKNSAC